MFKYLWTVEKQIILKIISSWNVDRFKIIIGLPIWSIVEWSKNLNGRTHLVVCPLGARWWVDDGGVVAKMWMTREEERLGVSRERIHDDRPPHESPPSEIPDAPLDNPASLLSVSLSLSLSLSSLSSLSLSLSLSLIHATLSGCPLVESSISGVLNLFVNTHQIEIKI